MKIIKVSTELEMSVHEFPEGTMREQNKALYDLIGNGCDIVEHVMPKRLYTELKMPSTPVKEPGKCVSMLIDEEGRLKPNKANLIGSYLYEFDKHGSHFVDSSDPGRDNSWYVCIRRGVTCDLCNTGTERKRRISCDSGPCMGGAEFFSDGYPVQERPGWNGRYSTDLYQYPAITYSYMVR